MVIQASQPTPLPLPLFAGSYEGTEVSFDGQDDPPEASAPSPVEATIIQDGDAVRIVYWNPFSTCKELYTGTATLNVFEGSSTMRVGGPSYCNDIRVDPARPMKMTLEGDTLTGRIDIPDHPTLPSWSEFTLTRIPTP